MSSRSFVICVFLAIAIAMLTVTLWSHRSRADGREVPAAFTDVVRSIATFPGGRVLLCIVWCWIAWHFLAR